MKNRYFANNCLIKVRMSEFLCIDVTIIAMIIVRTANFVLFFYQRFPFPFSHDRVTQRSVSQENAFKNSKYPSTFLRKTKAQIIPLL